ncbi:MAG: MFS transporter [Clostridia bacterium]|nr:MFS transporter [Clostridia bacterium]
MKLNYKRTLFVGFAFFLICLFWQAYDNIIPLILTNKFGMSQMWSGVIMALDNVFALFLLPFFGALSDRSASKRGKRTPFIVIGTLVAAVLFVGISVVDGMQRTKLADVTPDKYESSLALIYDSDPVISDPGVEKTDGMSFGEALKDVFSSGTRKNLSELISREEFLAIEMYGEDGKTASAGYTDYVVPARNAYAWQQTSESPATLIFFIVLLLCLLVAMGVFRSPAVALMPDVTPKPLRSKANAIINLMGAVGGIIVLLLGLVFKTGSTMNALMDYKVFFGICAGIMLAALAVFVITVKEPKWAAEADEINSKLDPEPENPGEGARKLTPAEKRSLIFILLSVALWFMGYNAITSKYSVYAGAVLDKDYNLTLMIAQAAAIVSYVPIGIISSKLGRKKVILGGIVMLTTAFFVSCFIRSTTPMLLINAMFILAGFGWASINVNSYPMVVELAKGSNVGRYTGYYYTASMAAQVVTPVLSGILLDVRLTFLFPYGTVFVALAFITMLFVKHGDSKPPKKTGSDILEHIDAGD